MGCCFQHSHAIPLFGTAMRITTIGLGEACASRARALAFDTALRLDALTRRDTTDSMLMRLCSAPVGHDMPVPDELWQLLRLANEIAYRSDGLFDIAAAGSAGRARWTDIDLSLKGHVRLRKRLLLDVGGLLKGFTADVAVETLKDMGAPAGIVDIGGVIRAFGPQEWRVQYYLAEHSAPLPVPLTDSAIAGGGTESHRLFNPLTGTLHGAAEFEGMRVLVRAPMAAMADALSKLAMIAPERACTLVPKLGGVAAILTGEGAKPLAYAS